LVLGSNPSRPTIDSACPHISIAIQILYVGIQCKLWVFVWPRHCAQGGVYLDLLPGDQGEPVPIDKAVSGLISASTLGDLQVRFRQFCAHFGVVKSAQVIMFGEYGTFCAFCTAEFVDQRAQETLIRSFGFKEIGNKVYLPLALPPDFERRAAIRAA
jgi:hypothetical protein